MSRGPQPVAGHPHWRAITYRTFDVAPDQRAASWVIAGQDAEGFIQIDTTYPEPIYELVIGVPRQDPEPLPALMATIDPRIPGPPELGKARLVAVDDTTMWFAVPQDWFFKRFQLEVAP